MKLNIDSTKLNKFMQEITPVYELRVYQEFALSQEVGTYRHNVREWELENSPYLNMAYKSIIPIWNALGLPVRSKYAFIWLSYAIREYHKMLDVLVEQEINQLIKGDA